MIFEKEPFVGIADGIKADSGIGRIQTALRKAREEFGPQSIAQDQAASAPPAGPKGARWAALQKCAPDPDLLDRSRVVTVNRTDPSHIAFDMLRTRVLQLMRQNKWTSIVVTSPTPQCGKTLVSLNLAFSLANQRDCRTVLVDMDLQRPQIGRLLGARNPAALEEFLNERIGVEDAFRRYGENIAIAANGRPVGHAAELLQSPATGNALRSLKQKLMPDVVIFDMPPMLVNDNVTAFLPNVDCAILVVAAEQTTRAEADLCERELSQRTNVLGVVLNKCRYAPEKYGY